MYINKQSNIQKRDLVSTKTASGNPVVITDCAGGKARSLKTAIEPIQDLHGYDHPWVGGAGKNLLNSTLNSYSNNGVTITKNDDGTYKLSGTATDTVWGERIGSVKLKAGTYKLVGWNPNTPGRSDAVMIYIESHTNIKDYGQGGTTFTIEEETTYYVRFVIVSGTTIDTVIKPMITKDINATYSDYAPYSNICPISGRTAAVLTRSDGDEISEDFTIQLGQTVYGADINWDTGVATVKTAKIDLGTLNYLTATVGGKTFYYADVPNAPQRDYTAISSDYPVTNSESEFFANDGIARAYGTTLYGGFVRVAIIDSRYSGYTTAQFKEAMSGVDYEYELATPIELTLTPTEVQMLKGYNRVTIESGSIELKALVLGGDY